MFAVLASLFVEDLIIVSQTAWVYSGQCLSSLQRSYWSFLYLSCRLSVLRFYLPMTLAQPPGKFIDTLEPNTILEYTLYPPSISENYFERTRNYPIYMIKYPGETVPTTGKAYLYNQGEAGLYEREVDYLVIDSFTYARFEDEHICQTNPVECEFFRQLLAGETNLRLLASFEYRLPLFLPQISLAAVNPDVKIYEVPR